MLIPNFAFQNFSMNICCCCSYKVNKSVVIKMNLETSLKMLIKVKKYADCDFRM